MAITYTTRQTRGRGLDVSGTDEGFRWTSTTEHQVTVSDPADPTFNPIDVDELDIITNADIPRVNGSVYMTTSGKQFPFLVCRNRSIKRHKDNNALFIVSSRFDFESRGNNTESSIASEADDPPVALTDISPVEEVTLGEGEEVMYKDFNGDAILTPTYNYFAEPTMERFAIFKLTITQYESSLSYDDFLNRKFKTNSGVYRTKPAGSWLIEDVRASEVIVTLAGGETTAALVKYDLAYTDKESGWNEDKLLVDTHYAESGKKKRFIDDDVNSLSYGLVNADGTKRTLAQGPVYKDFKVYDDIDFSTFLQV